MGWVKVLKDEKKKIHHLEEASIGGHPFARQNLGCHEGRNGRTERAIKHLVIAAGQGEDASIMELWRQFTKGRISNKRTSPQHSVHNKLL